MSGNQWGLNTHTTTSKRFPLRGAEISPDERRGVKRKHSGEENASPLKIRLRCHIKARLPAVEEEKKTVLCEIEYFQKNLLESDIDLKFLEPITNIRIAIAKNLKWETITFRAEDLRPGSTILHYSFTYERQVSDQKELEGRAQMELISSTRGHWGSVDLWRSNGMVEQACSILQKTAFTSATVTGWNASGQGQFPITKWKKR